MPYEIDYIPVGEGEKSGDAIALRYGNLAGPREQQTVIVIDGGIKESGERLVRHVNALYGTNHIDLLVSTHPDADHASGLCVVLESMEVGGLLIHKPWDHASQIAHLFSDGRITASGLENRIEESLQHAHDLVTMAARRRIPMVEPFQGLTLGDGVIHVLGPSQAYYESLLPRFRSTPTPRSDFGVFAPVRKAVEGAVRWLQDHTGLDLLTDDADTTSAENNSSTIILFDIDGFKLLFTGDAGKTALLAATAYAATVGISLTDLRFLDVPHHGSRRNLSSRVLKNIRARTAFVSAPPDSPKHPSKRITNALLKQGASVFVTRGSQLLQHDKGNARGWVDARPEPFHNYVEQ